MLVLDSGSGLGFELDGKTIYKSPSAAGSAVMNGTSCNGWRFWSVAGEREGDERGGRGARRRPRRKTSAKATPVRLIRKLPNQKGVPEGSTKWFCSACMKGFVAEGSETPTACPEGHGREEEDEIASVS